MAVLTYNAHSLRRRRRSRADNDAKGRRRAEAFLMRLKMDAKGDALVEAAILFPIMIMIFAALVLLAVYMPARAALQRATQYAATAVATLTGDTWLSFDEESMTYYWKDNKDELSNVYLALFSGGSNIKDNAESIVAHIEASGLSSKSGTLDVHCDIVNKIVYKEAVVTATREFKTPVNLSFIGFPESIKVTVTSTAVVQNGDEFIRNVDLAVDFVEFIKTKFHLDNVSDTISSFGSKVRNFLGW